MMKHILTLTLAALLLTGCDGFLERTSQNQIVPTTVDKYKELMQGSNGYFLYTTTYGVFVQMMTDDIAYTDLSDQVEVKNPVESTNLSVYRKIYQWADEIEEDEDFTDRLYEYLYSQALVANTVLEAIDDADGTDEEREITRGQAYFHRAFAYLMLANLYAKPYNEASADDPCVPVKLTATPGTETYSRATVSEVWNLIRSDIDAGIECLKGADIPNIYEISETALYTIAVRAALYMEDFDAVIGYGEKLLAINSELFDITGIESSVNKTLATPGGSDVKNLISSANPEILWLFGKNYWLKNILGGLADNHIYYYLVSDGLLDSYDQDLLDGERDMRKTYYFYEPKIFKGIASQWYSYNLFKYDAEDGYHRCQAFRTAEIYLSMAEAYARKASPDCSKALEYLNALRRNRISGYTDRTLADVGGEQGIVEYVWRERRRELCGEEFHRWFDLRREGEPEITHEWKDGKTYRLQKGDEAYILNFPAEERKVCPDNYNPRPYREADN
jgi:starch-binding outer membrane protein, SusD/RagB family